MNNQVLSIEQMQKLQELGIDTSKASMCWIIYPSLLNKNKRVKELVINSSANKRYFYITSTAIDYTTILEIPTFTLQDILEIIKEKVIEQDCSLDLELNLLSNQFQLTKEIDYLLYTSSGKTLLQSAFNMLKWCKENKYI